MAASAFAFALAAAAIHAGWNVLLAGAADSRAATAVATLAGVALFAPFAVAAGDLDASVWPYIAASAALELVYLALLGIAYDRAQVSVVYPVARGTAPVLVLLLAVAITGAGASVAQVAGVVAVGAGVLLVRGRGADVRPPDLVLALAIAASIAGYTLVDHKGVEHADPFAYLAVVLAVSGLVYTGWLLARGHRTRLVAELRPRTVAVGAGMFGAFALVLAALERAPAAPVAAVRESSVVFGSFLAAVLLREPVTRARAAGVALVALGVAGVALG